MMEGAFESEKAVHSFIPEYVPTPIAYGTYTSDPSMHFYLAEYIEMEDVVPEPHRWAEVVAALHQRSAGKSPGGKFGFHTPCYIANVALDATWNVSWEKLYTQQFRSICDIEEARQGANEDLARLKQAFLDIVIPRYLRPLESDGRSVQPTLLHNDLWVGAMKMRIEPPGTVCLHDSGAMWGHSECSFMSIFSSSSSKHLQLESHTDHDLVDLKLFRPNHRGLEKARELYREIVGGVSEPQEDFDARMQLYITVSLIHRFFVS
ncbi:hypothetical protein GQ53DRAFT_753014 [Thozetella sp. PMI_491]|nr:hypothetical protein GQ53DRAFT_753014 [Thozetella sp. PMI_491]